MPKWEEDYEDDAQSRFINERAHGNIQKDGTYSVVPRMFGGLCTANDLRAIADVSDKYDVPEMKVTGGQRVDLFGVRKEDLPAMVIVVSGGLGELFTLSVDEHKSLLSAAVAGAQGKFPVVAGVGGGYTNALRMARNAEEAGADACVGVA